MLIKLIVRQKCVNLNIQYMLAEFQSQKSEHLHEFFKSFQIFLSFFQLSSNIHIYAT